MRTTVTLDADVADQLGELMRERGLNFKQAVNDTLRRGLAAASPTPYSQQTHSLGWRPDVDYEHALRLASDLEDTEILRKLAQGR